jgi:hypothetical protein
VKTSDIRGAGTDANVYLTMFGEGPGGKPTKSPDLKLENSANNFERAKVRSGDYLCNGYAVSFRFFICHKISQPIGAPMSKGSPAVDIKLFLWLLTAG